jgi:hypothetical protein
MTKQLEQKIVAMLTDEKATSTAINQQKIMKTLDTSKNQTLEHKISSVLAANDATSDTLAVLIAEVENAVSDSTVRIERDRALDISVSPNVEAAHRALTEAELSRARLRLSLPDLQHKLDTVRAQEQAAQCEQEFLRVDALSDKGAEQFAEIPKLFAEIRDIFLETEAITAECSKFNIASPPGMHVVPPELKARGLTNFTQANPSVLGVTKLPDISHSELYVWPIHQPFTPAFAPPPAIDLNTTSMWGVEASARRRAADAKVDQELAEAEAAKVEFYRGR